MKAKLRSFCRISLTVSLFVMMLNGCGNANEDWIKTNYSQQEADNLQQQVDEGHRPGLMDWQQVAREFLDGMSELEADESKDSTIIADTENRKVVQYALADGRSVEFELIQPSQTGPTGIYVVSQYRLLDAE